MKTRQEISERKRDAGKISGTFVKCVVVRRWIWKLGKMIMLREIFREGSEKVENWVFGSRLEEISPTKLYLDYFKFKILSYISTNNQTIVS